MPSKIKGIPVAPLVSLLDTRSQVDLLDPGALRYRKNFQTENEKNLRRGMGWSKLLSTATYNNQDLHDQLLVFGGTAREPITMLAEVESTQKLRFLFAATQSRILRLNQYTGNWQLLGSGFGGGSGVDCSGPRFHYATVGDYTIFNNGLNPPQVYIVDSGTPLGEFPVNSEQPKTQTQNDLQLIGLQAAKKCWSWRNCLFLADVIVEDTRYPYRFYWSNVNNPISFDPAIIGTQSGFQDLEFGEVILAALPSGNSIIIYTNKRMWELFVNQSGDTNAPLFGVRQLPGVTDKNSNACLFYENTLVDIGSGHIYMGIDRIWFFNQWIGEPDPIEWVHASSNTLYDKINRDTCRAHIAGWHNNELLISVQTTDSPNGCPDITLRINTQYKKVDIVDHGFTAFARYRPQAIPTIREWITSLGICNGLQLTSAGFGFDKEALPNPVPPGCLGITNTFQCYPCYEMLLSFPFPATPPGQFSAIFPNDFGPAPGWVVFNNSCNLLGVANGAFTGDTQEEANANALAALDGFLQQYFDAGYISCCKRVYLPTLFHRVLAYVGTTGVNFNQTGPMRFAGSGSKTSTILDRFCARFVSDGFCLNRQGLNMNFSGTITGITTSGFGNDKGAALYYQQNCCAADSNHPPLGSDSPPFGDIFLFIPQGNYFYLGFDVASEQNTPITFDVQVHDLFEWRNNEVTFNNPCATGTLTEVGTLPPFVTIVGNSITLAAGSVGGDSQADADANALIMLQRYVTSQLRGWVLSPFGGHFNIYREINCL